MWTLLTYFSMYKSIDPVAGLPLLDLAGWSLREYLKDFNLEPCESKHNCNHHVLPLIVLQKLSKFINIFWII